MKPKCKNIKVEIEPREKVVGGIIIPDDSKTVLRIGKVVDGNGLIEDGSRVWHMNPKEKEIVNLRSVIYWV